VPIQQEALQVSNEIKKIHCKSIAIEADVSKEDDCFRLIEETINRFGRIDRL
jgi:NAD(P)-dependent dehydrogenase (short-subunit alcohol dehydrogenase family)